MSKSKTTAAVGGGCLLVIALAILPSMFLAWIVMLCAGAAGYSINYWPTVGIVFVLACLLGGSRSR